MADTIIERQSTGTSDSGAAGMVVAVVAIVLLLLGAYFVLRNAGVPAVPNTGSDINVTLPDTGGNNGGSNSGGSGGSGSGGGSGGTQ